MKDDPPHNCGYHPDWILPRISLFVAGGAKEPSANVSEEEFIINFIIVV